MKKTYRLKNLDCAHCAAKMETALGKLDGVTGVSVNFLTQKLTFEAPDTETFPGLALAYRAAREGGSMPTVFNAANEMAVKLLLQKKIRFVQIPEILEMAMEHHHTIENPDVVQILQAEAETYEQIRQEMKI